MYSNGQVVLYFGAWFPNLAVLRGQLFTVAKHCDGEIVEPVWRLVPYRNGDQTVFSQCEAVVLCNMQILSLRLFFGHK